MLKNCPGTHAALTKSQLVSGPLQTMQTSSDIFSPFSILSLSLSFSLHIFICQSSFTLNLSLSLSLFLSFFLSLIFFFCSYLFPLLITLFVNIQQLLGTERAITLSLTNPKRTTICLEGFNLCILKHIFTIHPGADVVNKFQRSVAMLK